MASSSRKIHNGYDYSCPLEGGEEDREWLQLGLGLGISRITTPPTTCRKQENNIIEKSKYTVPGSAVSSSSVHFQAHQQIGHSLGLELGLGVVGLNGGSGGVRRDKDVAPLSNYCHKSSLCQDNQGQEDHDYNLDLTARLSSPSCPLHMISSSSTGFLGWKMPVSNVSHNCSSLLPPPTPLFSPTTTITTRPHFAGLWFTLSSSINRWVFSKTKSLAASLPLVVLFQFCTLKFWGLRSAPFSQFAIIKRSDWFSLHFLFWSSLSVVNHCLWVQQCSLAKMCTPFLQIFFSLVASLHTFFHGFLRYFHLTLSFYDMYLSCIYFYFV